MNRSRPIYLDNHATTPCDPRVLEAFLPYFCDEFGNAASTSHAFGWRAGEAVDRAREQVAKAIGAEPREIIFTSGATESNNLAIKGIYSVLAPQRSHIATLASEHKAVLDPIKRLVREGAKATILKPELTGRVSLEALETAILPETALVSIMAANNEIGTIQDLGAIAEICQRKNVLFHTDATQAIGKIDLNVRELKVDLLSLSGHKIYGPKGIGALFIRREGSPVRVAPLFDGGGHERGVRSGTLAVPLIVGLGAAIGLAVAERVEESQRLGSLRDRLLDGLQERVGPLVVNGGRENRLPGNLNISVPGVDGEALMLALRDVAVSSGSACSAANPEPSHVLRAIGVDDTMSRASLRFGLGRFTTAEEIELAIVYVSDVISRLRDSSNPNR